MRTQPDNQTNPIIISQINQMQGFIHQIEKRQAKNKLAGLFLLILAGGCIGGLSYGYSHFDSQVDDLKETSSWEDCTTNGYGITRDEQCSPPTDSKMISDACAFLCAQIANTLRSRHVCFAGIAGMVVPALLAVWLLLGAPLPRNATNIPMDSLNRSIRDFFNTEFGETIAIEIFANDHVLHTFLRQRLNLLRPSTTAAPEPAAVTNEEKEEKKAETTTVVELEPLLRQGITNTTPPQSPRQRITSPNSTLNSPSYMQLD